MEQFVLWAHVHYQGGPIRGVGHLGGKEGSGAGVTTGCERAEMAWLRFPFRNPGPGGGVAVLKDHILQNVVNPMPPGKKAAAAASPCRSNQAFDRVQATAPSPPPITTARGTHSHLLCCCLLLPPPPASYFCKVGVEWLGVSTLKP